MSTVNTSRMPIGQQTARARRPDQLVPYILILPTILIILLVVIYPLIYSLRYSLTDYSLSRGQVHFVGLSNFIRAVRDPMFLHSLVITLVYVVGAVTIELVAGYILATFLNRLYRLQKVLLPLLILPTMMTPVVMGLIWKFMTHYNVGVLNYFLGKIGLPAQPWLSQPGTSLATLVALDIWMWTPFMALLILAGLMSLPSSPYEVAAIDGASPWLVFRRITIPLMKPVLLVALLLRTIDAMKTFDPIYVTTMGGPGTSTELVSLYTFKTAFRYTEMGYALALSWVLLMVSTFIAKAYIRVLSTE